MESTISSLSISYVKQDAGAELNWRPTKEWNVNAAYGYERYDYTQADAGATNENSVKASIDWKPFGWLTARASGYYADRIAENYNYFLNVASIQFPDSGKLPANWVRLLLFPGLSAIHVRQPAADEGGLPSRCGRAPGRHHHPDLQIQG